MKRCYFTLPELLIVIVTSGLIIALATGAAASLKNDPKTIACAKVMHDIEQLTTAYENAHGGTLISGNNNNRLWGSALVAEGYFQKNGYYDTNRTQPKGFECPAETRDRSQGDRKLLHPTTGIATSYDYGLNWLTHHKLTDPEQKNALRKGLKKTAILIRMLEGTKFALHPVPTDVTGRHGDGAGNVVFEDGHLEFMETIPYRDTDIYKREYWNE